MPISSEALRPKKPTLRDVARRAGIATSTASMALSGNETIALATRESVLAAARELGYEADFHAQRLRGRQSAEIGLFSLDVDLGIGTRKLQLIQLELHERGYSVPFFGAGYNDASRVENQLALMSVLLRQRPRAVICNTSGLHPAVLEPLRRYQNEEGGTVVAYDYAIDFPCDQVVFDHEESAYRGTRFLLELGHRDIGFLIVGRPVPDGPYFAGFTRALAEFGLQPRAEWLLRGNGLLEYEADGEQAAQQLLALAKRPSAVAIVNEHVALGLMTTLLRAGVSIPDELSILGFGSRAVVEHCPVPLTSLSHPFAAIAHAVVETLISRVEGHFEGAARTHKFVGELLPRQSCAPKTSS